MSKRLKFSIVTPSYNQVDSLPQTIESVISQNYSHLEYFIYDAKSQDGSDRIIRKYSKKYPNLIKYQIKIDRGQPDALNKAFFKASGDIFAFINSDDYYLPNAFNTVSQYFLDHPDCQWLVGDCQTNPKSFSWTFCLKELLPYHCFPKLLYLFNFINQPAVFIRRGVFKKTGRFDINLNYCFDYDFWLRLLKISPPHRLKIPLAAFRISNTSKGSTAFVKQFSEDYLVVKKYCTNSIILAIHYLLDRLIIISYAFLKKHK